MNGDRDDFDDDQTVAVSFDPGLNSAAGVQSGGAHVTVIAGARVGQMVRISEEHLVIGRGESVNFRINDGGASKEHLRIARGEDGVFVATDLGSRNGTRINGELVSEAALQDGDKIFIGSTTVLRFSCGDSLDEQFQQQMYEAALRDPLTSLYNRRHLTNQLEAEFWHAARHRLPLSFVLIDLDHFKELNDTHGHPTGDAVLRGFGSRLAASVRREDFTARYGGEEFAIICRQTDSDVACMVADRIRSTVETSQLVPDNAEVKVTLSAGVAGIPSPSIGRPLDLVKAADEALYEAKRAGRNCVKTYTDPATRGGQKEAK